MVIQLVPQFFERVRTLCVVPVGCGGGLLAAPLPVAEERDKQ
jgi:2-polyprenyl-3-methyl-5-hydroxy-6-metoxy-1,4-benzoquinol methylase